MTATSLIVHAESYSQSLNVVGEHITVLTPGKGTSHYEIFLQEGSEGNGPIPHTHPWDESFVVIRGEVDFTLEECPAAVAGVGSLVHIPAGTKHWFRFRRGGGSMISITSGRAASVGHVSRNSPGDRAGPARCRQADRDRAAARPDRQCAIGCIAAPMLPLCSR